jgi:DNA-binding CsgD family transcriptional regulator
MLTAREADVVYLLSRGCRYVAIAQALGISVHTVGSHIKNAYRKLDVVNAAAAVTRAAELGLLATRAGRELAQLRGDRGDARHNIGAYVDRDRLARRLERGELAFEEGGGHVAVAPLRKP